MQEIAAATGLNERALSTWQESSTPVNWAKALEAQLRDLIDKRNARVQILGDFNDLYHLRLGPLMNRIHRSCVKQLAVVCSVSRRNKRREKDYQSCPAIYFRRPWIGWQR